MAKIPLFNSTERLVTESPEARQSPQAAGQMGRDLQVEGNAITEAHNTIRNAYNFQQVGSAKIKTMEGVNAIEEKALADGENTSDLTPYENDLRQLKTDTLKTISDPSARAKFELDFDLQAAQTRTKVKTIMWTRMKEKGQTNTLILTDKHIGEYGLNPDPIYLKSIETDINEATKNGFYNSEQAYKLKQDKIGNAIEQAIYNDQSTQENQSVILAKLQDTENPIYEGLSNEQRLELVKKSQQRIFQNNQTFKRQVEVSQDQRNNSFIDKLAQGTATFKDIDEEFAIPESQGGVKRNVLLKYQDGLQTRVAKDLNVMLTEKPKNEDPTPRQRAVKEFNDLIDMYIEDTGDKWKAKEALAKAWADGRIDAEELKVLSPLRDNLNDIKFNKSNVLVLKDKIKEIKNWWRSQYNGNPIEGSEQEAINIKRLLSGVAKGEDPENVNKQIMDDNMRKFFPDYKSYSKEGKLKQDPNRGPYRIFPDGTWKWEAKKGKTE